MMNYWNNPIRLPLGKGTLVLLLFLAAIQAVRAQTAPELLGQMKQKYPEENAVMLQKKEKIDINIGKDGKLLISSEHFIDKLMLSSDASQYYIDEYIHFSSTFNEVTDIDASVWLPKGNKYDKTPVTTIETKSELSNTIFYDDNKFKHIVYPKVEKGTRAVISYREKINDPHFMNVFYFSSYMPMEAAEVSVTLPVEVKIKYKLFHDNGRIQFSEKKEKSSITYTWKAQGLSKYKRGTGSDGPSISYYEPHLVIYIDEYKANGVTKKVLPNVGELYRWYKELIKDVNTTPDPQLRRIVDSLCANAATPLEKVKKVFYWVQDNIKYVAFEDGMSGFIPREAAAVCTRRYGDCKDMASIISQMLRMADVPARITWIGSRSIPYTYSEVPTPIVDNHMIAAVKLDGQYIFLDATGQFTPLGMPTSFIQGKEALIEVDNEKFDVVAVPVVPKEKNTYADSMWVHLEGNTIKGRGKAIFTGYKKIDIVAPLSNRTEEKKKEIMSSILEKGNNKFHLSSYQLKGQENRDASLVADYEFEVQDYVKVINEEIYVNLHLDKQNYNNYIDKKLREVDVEVDHKSIERHVHVFEIPKGYVLSSLPDNASFMDQAFGFSISYQVKGNKIVLEKEIYVDTLYIKTAQFDQWNKMIDAISEAYNEVVVLKKQ